MFSVIVRYCAAVVLIMTTKLGIYFAPGHMRSSDFEYIRMLNPVAVRELDGREWDEMPV